MAQTRARQSIAVRVDNPAFHAGYIEGQTGTRGNNSIPLYGHPISEQDIVSLVRNLCEVMCEGWLTEEHLRHDCGVIAGWLRMTVDEGVGYLGGQRLAHKRPYFLVPALDTYANLSWHAMRRSRFDRGEYRQGFMTGFQDELTGLAHPLPPEQPVAFAY